MVAEVRLALLAALAALATLVTRPSTSSGTAKGSSAERLGGDESVSEEWGVEEGLEREGE